MSQDAMSDVAAAVSVAAESAVVVDRGPCLLCQLPVLSNQSRGMNDSGYFHSACLQTDGACYVCAEPVYNTEVCGFNGLGRYHVECIGKFHKVCYICKENVYTTEMHAYNKPRDKCYHTRCLEKVRAKCFECNLDILWKSKRIVLRSGVMIHQECKIKKTPDAESSVPQQINVGAKNLVPLFAEPGMSPVEKKVVEKKVVEKKVVEKKVVEKTVVEKKVVEKKDVIKGVCPFCKKNIYANEERAKDHQGRYFHISCHQRTHLRVEPGIAKKTLAHTKLKASMPQTIVATKPLLSSPPPRAAVAAVAAVAAKKSFVMSDTFFAQQDHHSRCESTALDM